MARPVRLSDDERTTIVERYGSGDSMAKVAFDLERSYSTVRCCLLAAAAEGAVEIRPSTKPTRYNSQDRRLACQRDFIIMSSRCPMDGASNRLRSAARHKESQRWRQAMYKALEERGHSAKITATTMRRTHATVLSGRKKARPEDVAALLDDTTVPWE